MTFSLTLVIVLVTVVVSFWAFNDSTLWQKLVLHPYQMKDPKEYYRLLSSGFIHADMQHLLFNMITLYFIGEFVEQYFVVLGHPNWFLALYLIGIIVASLPSFIKNRKNPYYSSLGASGGTSAIMFALVYIAPWAKIYIFFIPVWSILFAILFIVYSIYMSKKGNDYINHDAHLWGAVFGFVFCWLTDPSHGLSFLAQISRLPF